LECPNQANNIAVPGEQNHPVKFSRLQQDVHGHVQIGVGLCAFIAVLIQIELHRLLDNFVTEVSKRSVVAFLAIAVNAVRFRPVKIVSDVSV